MSEKPSQGQPLSGGLNQLLKGIAEGTHPGTSASTSREKESPPPQEPGVEKSRPCPGTSALLKGIKSSSPPPPVWAPQNRRGTSGGPNKPEPSRPPYIDMHYISALVRSGSAVVFSQEEIDQADREWKTEGRLISSVCRNGIHVGLTANEDGEQRFFSAYAKGFWLGILDVSPDGARNTFNLLSVPPAVLATIGTEAEDRGRRVSGLFSARAGREANGISDQPGVDGILEEAVSELQSLAETRKTGFHVTSQTTGVLESGGSLSGRVNAIVARYEAMLADPSLVPAIAETERIEREILPR